MHYFHLTFSPFHTQDSLGRVWTLGDNKYGSLGRRVVGVEGKAVVGTHPSRSREAHRDRDRAPGLVEGLPGGVFWVRGVCGWSHVCVRGVGVRDGESVFFGWGRGDLGQLASHVDARASGGSSSPVPLPPLPSNLPHPHADSNAQVPCMWEVHAGAEHTLVVGTEGFLVSMYV